MKLLAVLVSIIAAIAANTQQFPDDGPEKSAPQAQLLKETAISAVDDSEAQEQFQTLNEIPSEELGFNFLNSPVEHRAQEESCEDVDGVCISKKTITIKCNGKVEKSLKCKKKKDACCISESNQCMAENGGHSVLWEQIQSGDLLLKNIINEGNDNITIDIDIKFSTLKIKMENIKQTLQSGDLQLKDTINEGNDNITVDIDSKFSTLEIKMDNITETLQSVDLQLKDTINEGNDNITIDIDIKFSTLDIKMENITQTLQSGDLQLKDTINEGNNNITVEINSKFSTLKIKMENITKEQDYMKHQLDYIIHILNSSAVTTTTEKPTTTTTAESTTTTTTPTTTTEYLTTTTTEELTTTTTRCSPGFFNVNNSSECFKLYNDVKRTWAAAKSKCQQEGLQHARPNYPDAVSHYIRTNHVGCCWTWLDAKADGSYMRWETDNEIISSSNPYVFNYYFHVSSGQCLTIMTNGYGTDKPTTPYASRTCTSSYWTLCEEV